jgi:hypothetical protein
MAKKDVKAKAPNTSFNFGANRKSSGGKAGKSGKSKARYAKGGGS